MTTWTLRELFLNYFRSSTRACGGTPSASRASCSRIRMSSIRACRPRAPSTNSSENFHNRITAEMLEKGGWARHDHAGVVTVVHDQKEAASDDERAMSPPSSITVSRPAGMRAAGIDSTIIAILPGIGSCSPWRIRRSTVPTTPIRTRACRRRRSQGPGLASIRRPGALAGKHTGAVLRAGRRKSVSSSRATASSRRSWLLRQELFTISGDEYEQTGIIYALPEIGRLQMALHFGATQCISPERSSVCTRRGGKFHAGRHPRRRAACARAGRYRARGGVTTLCRAMTRWRSCRRIWRHCSTMLAWMRRAATDLRRDHAGRRHMRLRGAAREHAVRRGQFGRCPRRCTISRSGSCSRVSCRSPRSPPSAPHAA